MFVGLKPWDDRKGKEHHVQCVIKQIQQRTASIKEARILAISPPAIPCLGSNFLVYFSAAANNQYRQYSGV
jgi:HAE1 family hydrophobic/amphiphilic exporter-1